MSTGKTTITSTQFASKKLLGKAHTSNFKTDVNESIPSNVSMLSNGIMAQEIPNSPGTDFYTLYSSSLGAPATVERIYLDVVALSDTQYDANDVGGGGDEASVYGPHGYYLKLPSNYESTSSNPNAGSGNYTNGKRIYDSRGGLQLVPPFASNASPNRYFLKLYTGDPTNPANEITSGDSIDWQVDYYSGVIFIQDYNSSRVPVSASAYLYVGDYLNNIVAGSTAINNPVENRMVTVAADGTTLDAESNLTFDGSTMNLTGTLNVSGAVNANELNINVTNKTIINLSATGSTNFGDTTDDQHLFVGKVLIGEARRESTALLDITGSGNNVLMMVKENGNEDVDNIVFGIIGSDFTEIAGVAGKIVTNFEISSSQNISASYYYGDGSNLTGINFGGFYGRTSVTTTLTASASDKILGINASSNLEIRLPSAGDYVNGQFFTVKDEGGNADIYSISILTSGSQTIDGQTSIILESPYAAVNIYSNGLDKFFIY